MLKDEVLGGFFRFSRNPLGIIALFIVLIYGVAGYVTTSTHLQDVPQLILVIFLVTFPFMVLLSFHILVSKHFFKLFGPQDIGQGEFSRIVDAYLPADASDASDLGLVKKPADSKEGATEQVIDLQSKLLGDVSVLDRTSLYIDAIWNSKENNRKRSIFKQAFRNNNDLTTILADEKNRNAIFDVLNTLEAIADEIYTNKLNIAEVRQRIRLLLPIYWPNARKVIEKIRQETSNPGLYKFLEQLANDWRASKPSKLRKAPKPPT